MAVLLDVQARQVELLVRHDPLRILRRLGRLWHRFNLLLLRLVGHQNPAAGYHLHLQPRFILNRQIQRFLIDIHRRQQRFLLVNHI